MIIPSLDPATAIRLAAAIAAVGIVWDTVELTSARKELLNRFFEWRVVRSRYYILIDHPARRAVFDIMLSGRTFVGITVLHGLAAIAFVIVLPVSRPLAALFAALVLLGHLCIHLRLLVGMDGADQMQSVIWAGLFIYALNLGHFANGVAAIFICVQLVLSYLVSGVAKLASPTWRSGAAIGRITRTGTYCSPGLSAVLQNSRISFTLSWAVIIWEVCGCLALLGGHYGLLVFIVIGIAFHIGIALSMGLSTFVFAFLAAYPILFVVVS